MTTPFRISFTVDGPPVPKQRAQSGKFGSYYPERGPNSRRLDYPSYKELVRVQCAYALQALDHPRCEVGWLWGLKVTAWVGAGDGDNIAGSFADALQGILWENDSQIRHWECDVIRTKPKEYRGATILAWTLEE
mgnify:CR=1 FL=1